MTSREWRIEGCSYEHPYIAIKASEQTVCMIGCVGNLEEKKANAVLIAAAPEMYRVLQEVREYCQDKEEVPVDLKCDIWEALDRAEGKS